MGKEYDELGFTDDFIFCKILSTNSGLCRELLAIILNKKVEKIKVLEKQKPIEITSDGKGIRLDVYVEEEDVVYDIEMQTTTNANLPKRTRYYQGMIDLNLIERGADYTELKASYIIFICLRDPFNKGAAVYTLQNRCIEYDDVYLNDESTIIFLNAEGSSGEISEELREFLDYVLTGTVKGQISRKLDCELSKAKKKEEWRLEYMALSIRDIDKRNEGKIEMLVTLVKDGLLGKDEAIKRSGLSESEFEKLLKADQN